MATVHRPSPKIRRTRKLVAKFGRNEPGAFSLMELLVCFSVILILAALLMPAILTARENARKVKCATNMRQYGVAFRLYQTDHKGMYPRTWVDNSHNWESYLCGTISVSPYVGANTYLPSNFCTFTGAPGPAKRIKGEYLCPTVVKRYNISASGTHDQWGYCYNSTRIDISYDAANWPWFNAQYQNADLDAIYPKVGISAVMTCGNNASWNSDNDWNCTTSINVSDWPVASVHADVVNVLFLDGHVESVDISTANGVSELNFFWYNAIDADAAPFNPWQ